MIRRGEGYDCEDAGVRVAHRDDFYETVAYMLADEGKNAQRDTTDKLMTGTKLERVPVPSTGIQELPTIAASAAPPPPRPGEGGRRRSIRASRT